MKFKSQVYTQVSGSVGGITYYSANGGMIARARALPVDPGSAQQIAVRGAMADMATRWGSTLSAAQRSAWSVYAQAVSVIDVLGNAIFLSGINQYVRSNVERYVAGQALIDAAPTIFDLGNDTNPSTAIFSVAAQTCSFAWAAGVPAWFAEDDAFGFPYVSRPFSPGKSFFKGPYRVAAAFEGDLAIPLTSPQAAAAPFPFVLGQKISGRLTVSRADGRRTTPFRFIADVVA